MHRLKISCIKLNWLFSWLMLSTITLNIRMFMEIWAVPLIHYLAPTLNNYFGEYFIINADNFSSISSNPTPFFVKMLAFLMIINFSWLLYFLKCSNWNLFTFLAICFAFCFSYILVKYTTVLKYIDGNVVLNLWENFFKFFFKKFGYYPSILGPLFSNWNLKAWEIFVLYSFFASLAIILFFLLFLTLFFLGPKSIYYPNFFNFCNFFFRVFRALYILIFSRKSLLLSIFFCFIFFIPVKIIVNFFGLISCLLKRGVLVCFFIIFFFHLLVIFIVNFFGYTLFINLFIIICRFLIFEVVIYLLFFYFIFGIQASLRIFELYLFYTVINFPFLCLKHLFNIFALDCGFVLGEPRLNYYTENLNSNFILDRFGDLFSSIHEFQNAKSLGFFSMDLLYLEELGFLLR